MHCIFGLILIDMGSEAKLMPIYEGNEFSDPDFLQRQIDFDRKVERLKKVREENRQEDIAWMEEAYED